jgi:hypothetical protein
MGKTGTMKEGDENCMDNFSWRIWWEESIGVGQRIKL